MIIPNLVTDDNYHENKTTAVKVCLTVSIYRHIIILTSQYNFGGITMARASKKGLIMKTAKQLFAEKGYDATGMEEIVVSQSS